MKKIFLSFTIVAVTAFGLMIPLKKANAEIARVPFAGQISYFEVCCNGLLFYTTGQYLSPTYGSFIMNWATMEPQPEIGLGLYSYWNLTAGEKTLGDSIPGGVCVVVESECETTIPAINTVLQAGTTLYPTV